MLDLESMTVVCGVTVAGHVSYCLGSGRLQREGVEVEGVVRASRKAELEMMSHQALDTLAERLNP
jgi:hypothetical protein